MGVNQFGYLISPVARKAIIVSVNQNLHKAVVIVNESATFGFVTITNAVAFVEQQIAEGDAGKTFTEVVAAMSEDGTLIEGIRYQILDITTYLDLYEDEEDDDTEE